MLRIKLTFRSIFRKKRRLTSSSTAKLPNFHCFREVTSRFRMTTNADQGFSTNQKFQPKKLTDHKTAGTKCLSPVVRLPILCEYEHFVTGVKRLRGVKDTSHLTLAEVYHQYSKSANLSARKLLLNDIAGRVFSDFKTIPVAITHLVFRRHELDLDGWVKVARGRDSPVVKWKCSVVIVKVVKDDHHKQWTL